MSSSSSSLANSPNVIKAVAATAIATGLEMFLNGKTLNRALMSGVASASGVIVGNTISSVVTVPLPDVFGQDTGNGLSQRIVEVGSGVATAYILNNYVLKNTGFSDNMGKTIAILTASDLGAEIVKDYFVGSPIAMFQ